MNLHGILRSLPATVVAAAFVIAMLPTLALNPQPLPPGGHDISLLSSF